MLDGIEGTNGAQQYKLGQMNIFSTSLISVVWLTVSREQMAPNIRNDIFPTFLTHDGIESRNDAQHYKLGQMEILNVIGDHSSKSSKKSQKSLICSNTNSNGNSRSPTRSSTNTIANTYHYSYGNKNSSNSGGADIGDNIYGLNGNISNGNSSNNNNHNIYGRNTPTYGVDTLTKTPARHDFDELLRERREKVFNEYRSTTHEVLAATPPPNRSPLPPPRRFVNGTVQLPSTLPPSLNNGRGSSMSSYSQHQGPQVPQRNPGKFNYDFQFNLNLDEREDANRD
ncbi:putative uncharacterized protein DDB_G0282133, partial [Musca vetustissima]|uniref:putative uncharacterized protein DDB_G0282133 n=1 Tax=Musca vetustissima TaxID=27455 RepID=UPI002AB79F55